MKARAFFSNNDGDCRLEITHKDGHKQHVLFEEVSSMVNYCNEHSIVAECLTED